jgi:alkylresorcinol/alkylpyrone synthase
LVNLHRKLPKKDDVMNQSTAGLKSRVSDQHHPSILGVGVELAPHYYTQEALIDAFSSVWEADSNVKRRMSRLHNAVQVNGRHLALSIPEHLKLDTFGQANDAFIKVGTEIGARAVEKALLPHGLEVTDVDAIFFTTVTGLATPTIDARLVNRLGFRPDVKRTPLFGLGCVGGAAGVARMSDYLRAFPSHCAILISVELCSLTLQLKDLSIPNLISSGLFGDGAACVVGVGAQRSQAPAGVRVLDTRSTFFPDTQRVMGWDINERGFNVVLSAGVPDIAKKHIAPSVDAVLENNGLAKSDVDAWVCHPGGPKVLDAIQASLEIERSDLQITWDSLSQIGNLSSASVLHVFAETFEQRDHVGHWVMLAMGPGFCAEVVLLEW